ncbi:MAG: BrnA antitoxin family protein [Nitrospirota bacterium]
MSDAQLRAMRRVGRPRLGEVARQLIAIRIDPQVLEDLRKEAKRRDIGYQTLINNILAEHAKKKTA